MTRTAKFSPSSLDKKGSCCSRSPGHVAPVWMLALLRRQSLVQGWPENVLRIKKPQQQPVLMPWPWDVMAQIPPPGLCFPELPGQPVHQQSLYAISPWRSALNPPSMPVAVKCCCTPVQVPIKTGAPPMWWQFLAAKALLFPWLVRIDQPRTSQDLRLVWRGLAGTGCHSPAAQFGNIKD